MFTIQFLYIGVTKEYICEHKSVFALVWILEKQEIPFKVFSLYGRMSPTDFGFGKFGYWLDVDENFNYDED